MMSSIAIAAKILLASQIQLLFIIGCGDSALVAFKMTTSPLFEKRFDHSELSVLAIRASAATVGSSVRLEDASHFGRMWNSTEYNLNSMRHYLILVKAPSIKIAKSKVLHDDGLYKIKLSVGSPNRGVEYMCRAPRVLSHSDCVLPQEFMSQFIDITAWDPIIGMGYGLARIVVGLFIVL